MTEQGRVRVPVSCPSRRLPPSVDTPASTKDETTSPATTNEKYPPGTRSVPISFATNQTVRIANAEPMISSTNGIL